VLITHDTSVASCADRTLVLDDGRIAPASPAGAGASRAPGSIGRA
jgi:ABC-type lipoprotein export system ATPase subunit